MKEKKNATVGTNHPVQLQFATSKRAQKINGKMIQSDKIKHCMCSGKVAKGISPMHQPRGYNAGEGRTSQIVNWKKHCLLDEYILSYR